MKFQSFGHLRNKIFFLNKTPFEIDRDKLKGKERENSNKSKNAWNSQTFIVVNIFNIHS